MKVKNINVASKRTENSIKEAFAQLLNEKKELRNISVTELVKHAGITRSAFYTHYDSVYDLAEEIQDETLDFFLEGTDEINNLNDLNKYFDKVSEHLKENEEFYSMLLASNEQLRFTSKLNKLLQNKMKDYFSSNKMNNLELNINFFADGCISLIVKHLKKENNLSLDEINVYMKDMFIKIFK